LLAEHGLNRVAESYVYVQTIGVWVADIFLETLGIAQRS